MAERPILFSAPMVNAILDGRKTQTRRVTRLPKWAGANCIETNERDMPLAVAETTGCLSEIPCPYGQPGDRLWVRETCRAEELPSGLDGVRYISDSAFREIENTPAASEAWCAMHAYRGKRGATVPPIHMPHWASRILLEITGVRVERLQDISEADAIAEGWIKRPEVSDDPIVHEDAARDWYSDLWDSINGPGSWAANPWVWVIEFRMMSP